MKLCPSIVCSYFFLCISCFSKQSKITCDIVIGGGSTSALSSAIAAAQSIQSLNLQDDNLFICLLEPTDWPGGQLTSSGVSAIDFGTYSALPQNQPSSLRELISSISGNPGQCWVSTKCYEPQNLLNNWIFPTLDKLEKNLKIFYHTVVSQTFLTIGERKKGQPLSIDYIRAIQRTPFNYSEEWNKPLSDELNDWYSPNQSDIYSKEIIDFYGKIFIEVLFFYFVLFNFNTFPPPFFVY